MRALSLATVASILLSIAIAIKIKKNLNFYKEENCSTISYILDDTTNSLEEDVDYKAIFVPVDPEEAIPVEAIEVIELEETVILDFDTQHYLPLDFDPYTD
jgi:hypothetical protein